VERAGGDAAKLVGARRQPGVKLSHEVISLDTRYPFVIARGGYASHENVVVRIVDDQGMEGWGEAAPNRYYGESVGSVLAALEQFVPVLSAADAWSLEAIEAHLNRTLRGNGSAKSAISAASENRVSARSERQDGFRARYFRSPVPKSVVSTIVNSRNARRPENLRSPDAFGEWDERDRTAWEPLGGRGRVVQVGTEPGSVFLPFVHRTKKRSIGRGILTAAVMV